MPDNMKWKYGLLSSSMPLELEASRVLTSKGFTVSSNYKYDKGNTESVRNLSVDLYAKTSFLGTGRAKLEILMECRHRHPNMAWFFMPDPNPAETSPAIPGNAIRIVDKFSSYVIESAAAAAFDAGMPVCQKGLEIDTATGDVDESPFRQGLSQLQYAIPYLLTENVLYYMEEDPVENLPFIFCPIFLASPKLFVLKKEVSAGEIEASSHIEDVADETPHLMMHLDYSKDFETRCISEVSRLKELQRSDKAMIVERKRAGYYETDFNLPFTIIESLMDADRCYLEVLFTQFLICNRSHFPGLVDTIKATATSALETQRLLD